MSAAIMVLRSIIIKRMSDHVQHIRDGARVPELRGAAEGRCSSSTAASGGGARHADQGDADRKYACGAGAATERGARRFLGKSRIRNCLSAAKSASSHAIPWTAFVSAPLPWIAFCPRHCTGGSAAADAPARLSGARIAPISEHGEYDAADCAAISRSSDAEYIANDAAAATANTSVHAAGCLQTDANSRRAKRSDI